MSIMHRLNYQTYVREKQAHYKRCSYILVPRFLTKRADKNDYTPAFNRKRKNPYSVRLFKCQRFIEGVYEKEI